MSKDLNQLAISTIEKARELLTNPAFIARHRKGVNNFIRNCKLTFSIVMLLTLQKSLKSIQIHLKWLEFCWLWRCLWLRWESKTSCAGRSAFFPFLAQNENCWRVILSSWLRGQKILMQLFLQAPTWMFKPPAFHSNNEGKVSYLNITLPLFVATGIVHEWKTHQLEFAIGKW